MNLIHRGQITKAGKIFSGSLLILFILLPAFFIIAFWPDRLPEANGSQKYRVSLFHVRQVAEAAAITGTLHLNTLLFLLVALAGFLGSMIHLSTSFTNYLSAGQLKSNWLIWYLVKPFTATGVSLVFYFLLKAGLLNFDNGGGINLYGIVILSALTGLYTDKATLKLEEIFTTIFKPKDERPEKLKEKLSEEEAMG